MLWRMDSSDSYHTHQSRLSGESTSHQKLGLDRRRVELTADTAYTPTCATPNSPLAEGNECGILPLLPQGMQDTQCSRGQVWWQAAILECLQQVHDRHQTALRLNVVGLAQQAEGDTVTIGTPLQCLPLVNPLTGSVPSPVAPSSLRRARKSSIRPGWVPMAPAMKSSIDRTSSRGEEPAHKRATSVSLIAGASSPRLA